MGISDEYDVELNAWKIYKKMYENNLDFTEDDIIRNDGRAYLKCIFKHNEKSTELMKFSGETDFNFSTHKKRELCRSRYEHYRKILERDLAGNEELSKYIEMLNKCSERHHSQENISIMPKSGNMQGVKGSVGLDRLDVWLLVLDLKYTYKINLLQNHCTMENYLEIDKFLNLFDDVFDYANTIYHIDRDLVKDLIESGKNPLVSASYIITYMSLANRFWEQKRKFIEEKNPEAIGYVDGEN
ncbi:MAG: hypothetical protein K2P09_09540 [Erysipelotrichales bacterium]|nr:hypothetical protein [Erysipelotrichales bacterium]